ncbi:MAG: sulfurtransferase complex subunit TusC [Buchnera aphidicola (Schlechtendalia peitan)]
MKSIAFIFSRVPHGTSISREGLDSVLSISMINQNIAVFFIGDGVFQLMKFQHPKYILSRNYALSFGMLPFFDINKLYYCKDSLIERGLLNKCDLFLKVFIIDRKNILKEIDKYDLVINY